MNPTIPVMKAFWHVTGVLTRVALGLVLAATLAVMLAAPSQVAALTFDQNVTPDVIFGSGNPNGNFTVDQNNGIELGLRAKIPFVGTTNSNGDGTYTYSFAEQNTAIATPAGQPQWNFDWTVNVDFASTSPLYTIDAHRYLLQIDYVPARGPTSSRSTP